MPLHSPHPLLPLSPAAVYSIVRAAGLFHERELVRGEALRQWEVRGSVRRAGRKVHGQETITDEEGGGRGHIISPSSPYFCTCVAPATPVAGGR